MSVARESELELKLELTHAELQRVRAHPALGSLAVGEPVTRTLRSIYFDTPDYRLRALGISFRLRSDGDSWLQTVKSGTAVAQRGVEADRGGGRRRAAGAGSAGHRQSPHPPQGREGGLPVDPGAGVRDGRAAHHAAAALGRRRAGAGARRGRRARRQRREQPVRGRAGAQVGKPGVPAADGRPAVRHGARSPRQGQPGRARLQPGAGQGQRSRRAATWRAAATSPPITPVRKPSPSSCNRRPPRSPPIGRRCWRQTTRTPPISCASACGGCAARCLPFAP